MSDEGEFDWDLLMRFGLGALGLAPRDFWRMTPAEFDAAVKGRAGIFSARSGKRPGMTRERFGALSARFPDEGRPT